MFDSQDLSQGWKLRCAGPDWNEGKHYLEPFPWLDATVPGFVHQDLHRHGVIPDPIQKMHEISVQWVDESDWHYQCEFDWVPSENPRQVLIFHGLDTFATVILNGEELGQTESMFLKYEFEVTGKLKEGTNTLEVLIESVNRKTDQLRREYFEKEGLPLDTACFEDRAFASKVQCMFGWDWGPRIASCGIWREVELVEFSGRLKESWIQIEPAGDGNFWLTPHLEIDGELEFSISLHAEDFDVKLDLKPNERNLVEKPNLWWPAGYGDPHIYNLLIFAGQDLIAEHEVGFKTVELVRQPDAIGESFEFVINGQRIFASGANIIPFSNFFEVESKFFGYPDPAELNFNMLRVWGGGNPLLKNEDFAYSSILLWIDFPHACSYYPDDERAQELARKVGERIVKLYSGTPQIALFCGNNENLQMWQQKWHASDKHPDRYCGEKLYEEVYAKAVADLAPGVPYIPTSPIGTPPEGKDSELPNVNGCNAGRYGDSHYWDVWHGRGDWKHYEDSDTRFSSEFGFPSACSMLAWKRAGLAEALPTDPAVRHHNRTRVSLKRFMELVELHYPASSTLEEWVRHSQLNQRDAFRFGIEHFRMLEGCYGSLIWQWNDIWPVESWAVVDYCGILKPAALELKRLYAPLVASVRFNEGRAEIGVANETGQSYAPQLDLKVILYDAEGTVFDLSERQTWTEQSVDAYERKWVSVIDLKGLSNDQIALAVTCGDHTSVRVPCEPKESALFYQRPRVTRNGLYWTISSDRPVLDYMIMEPMCVSANLNIGTPVISLYPGQMSVTVKQYDVHLDPDWLSY